jgi:hypothetical protein
MFQYAVGRALATQNSRDLILNTGAFHLDSYYKRNYALDVFNLRKTVGLTENTEHANRFIRLLALSDKHPYLRKIVNLLGFIERPFVYDPNLLKRRRIFSNVLVGYWQDERYFSHIRSQLLADFTPAHQLSIENQKIANIINSTPSMVAIHLRCNHEVAAAATVGPSKALEAPKSGSANVLSRQYYQKAIAAIHGRVESPKFIVFSDNPAWVKASYDCFDVDSVLENNRGSDWEDLVLMSKCKHHIIANSSFSWWGAWLADPTNQLVIAPLNYPYTPNIPSRWNPIG